MKLKWKDPTCLLNMTSSRMLCRLPKMTMTTKLKRRRPETRSRHSMNSLKLNRKREMNSRPLLKKKRERFVKWKKTLPAYLELKKKPLMPSS